MCIVSFDPKRSLILFLHLPQKKTSDLLATYRKNLELAQKSGEAKVTWKLWSKMKELLYDTATSRPRVEISSTDGKFVVSTSSTSTASLSASKPSAADKLLQHLEASEKSSKEFQEKLLAALTGGDAEQDRARDERLDKLEQKIDTKFDAIMKLLQAGPRGRGGNDDDGSGGS